ncbi:NADPH-dependent FMN reductase [Nonlabens ulvanivorans]|uniref:NADPH-dependent FMN reductase n=1 Tax=Nonlabens ulvanivorans TaxID=906888 RepID=UPI00294227FD|nr:NAD(P)H-dependent oxidoreductase [Nonlabens ulvanivorans]WOI23994.1 NAD(P)H-dependent oxidoreductase [Nonlabens ulvanivorans]
MKITAFAGSNSKTSINKRLVTYTASLFNQPDTTVLDLNDYDMPLYGMDLELENGIPNDILKISTILKESDLLIISLAEHNGAYATVFKNLFDWLSRVDGTKGFHNKPIFLMASSPGGRGGASVLEIAKARLPFNDGEVIDTYSLPNFSSNFNDKDGITDPELKSILLNKIEKIKSQLKF